jgi:hypothetical protein
VANTYQPRWPVVLAVAAPTGLLLGRSEILRGLPVMGPLLMVIGTITHALRLRGRGLTVRDDALVTDRRVSPVGAACPAC